MIELLGIFAFIAFAAFVGLTTLIIVVRCAIATAFCLGDLAESAARRILG